MFTTIVSWVTFVLTSVIFITAILNELLKSKTHRELEEILSRMSGKRKKVDWNRVFVLFVFWFAAGWYLFG